MRRGIACIAVMLMLGVGASCAVSDSATNVAGAIVGRGPAGVERFTLRFSKAMVALGRQSKPLTMTCAVPGEGRWVDPQTYVWRFAQPLPAGTACRATLADGLKDTDGATVSGTTRFPIDGGGPSVLAILPEGGDIEERQAFLLAVNGPVDRASIAANAYCAVEGIGERIPVDLLPPPAADKIIGGTQTAYATSHFLESAGLPQPLPAAAKQRAAALANVVALQCHRPSPPGHAMSLVWGGSIRAPGGQKVGQDHRFDFKVRPEFTARLTCSRANAAAGCDPIEAIAVTFSAPVFRAEAMKLRLDLGEGHQRAPKQDKSDHSATVEALSFTPPFPPAINARLLVPSGLRDESGRDLANARRFPLAVPIADAPPLVKFAAPFGVIEAREGAVLPVTVRSVEPRLSGDTKAIAGATVQIGQNDDAAIARWLRKVSTAQADDFREEKRGKESVTVNHTGDRSVFDRGTAGKPMQVPLPAGGRKMEVVGIPLGQPGFYVVELASPRLGQALLGRPATRYVAASALVTNMAVHFKWGRGVSLAWVTALDTGKPVADATITVTDSCSGRRFGTAKSDRGGRVMIRGLPDPSSASDCDSHEEGSAPLLVSARKDGDLSFVLTSWSQGIQPWAFDLPYGWTAPEPIFHTIFDRTLLRAGETVHMTHVYRKPVLRGLQSGGAIRGVLQFAHRGSDIEFDVPVVLDRAGMGESSWTPPKGAPTGDYDLKLKIGDDVRSTGQSIRVDEYRLPTMRASVSGPREPLVRPKRVPLDLYVGYLSGGGAGRAPVRLRAAFETLSDTPTGWEGWSFGGAA